MIRDSIDCFCKVQWFRFSPSPVHHRPSIGLGSVKFTFSGPGVARCRFRVWGFRGDEFFRCWGHWVQLTTVTVQGTGLLIRDLGSPQELHPNGENG